jgi:hypothetical protein
MRHMGEVVRNATATTPTAVLGALADRQATEPSLERLARRVVRVGIFGSRCRRRSR